MYFQFSEEQKIIRDTTKKFMEERLAPRQKDDEKKGVFRRELVSEMGKLGFFGSVIPEEYGGTNTGFLTAAIITEEIAKVSASYAGLVNSQATGPGLALLKYGTKEQKDKYLPRLVSGDAIGSVGVTEPDAGSDVASMKMTARKNEKGYVLNGTKTWITNAPVADLCLVFAYTSKEMKYQGISCFLVEMKEIPGITTHPIETLGLSCSLTGEINFQEVQLPADCLLGTPGKGFPMVMEMFGNLRLFAAACAMGLGGACLEASVKYVKERQQFGQQLAKFQMIQEQIAEMYIELEAAKLLVYQTALNKDKGKDDNIEGSLAKYVASEAAVKAADVTSKIFGAYGFSMEYPVQRFVRDSRAFTTFEGTSNIQKMIMVKQLLNP